MAAMKKVQNECSGCGKTRWMYPSAKYCKECRKKLKKEKLRKITQVGTYQARDAVLLELGYASYADYLAGEVWKKIRRRAYGLYGNKCKICGSPANHIHHVSYSIVVLVGKDMEKLAPVCGSCHHKIEFFDDGTKRPLYDTYKKYHELFYQNNPQEKVRKKQPTRKTKTFIVRAVSICLECKVNGRHPKSDKYCKQCIQKLLVEQFQLPVESPDRKAGRRCQKCQNLTKIGMTHCSTCLRELGFLNPKGHTCKKCLRNRARKGSAFCSPCSRGKTVVQSSQ